MGNCNSAPADKPRPPAKAPPAAAPAAAKKVEKEVKHEVEAVKETPKEPEAPKPEAPKEPVVEKPAEPVVAVPKEPEVVKEVEAVKEEVAAVAEPSPVVTPPPAPAPTPEPVKEEPQSLAVETVDAAAKSAPAVTTVPVSETPIVKKRKVRTLDLEAVRNMISEDTNRYVLGDKLGKGAYGIVMKATDNETGEVVAVKRVAKSILAKEGEAGEKRLHREVAIMGTLTHPNLVNLKHLCYEATAKEMWIVVELVEGAELMKCIKDAGKLDENTARGYFQQLVCGVNYVHSQKIAHRDLKPENILVTEDGKCKITDFGLSNVQNTDTMGAVPSNLNMQTCCGTPYYVAPEVVTKSEGYSGFTADVWSLGVILYVMLTGDLPFTAGDLNSLLRKIGRGDYKQPEGVSDGAAGIIKKILNHKVAKRSTLLDISKDPWFVEGGFDAKRMENEGFEFEIRDNASDYLSKTMAKWSVEVLF